MRPSGDRKASTAGEAENGVTSGSCPWWLTRVLYGNFD